MKPAHTASASELGRGAVEDDSRRAAGLPRYFDLVPACVGTPIRCSSPSLPPPWRRNGGIALETGKSARLAIDSLTLGEDAGAKACTGSFVHERALYPLDFDYIDSNSNYRHDVHATSWRRQCLRSILAGSSFEDMSEERENKPAQRSESGSAAPLKSWVRALEMTAPIAQNPKVTLPVLIDTLADKFENAEALVGEEHATYLSRARTAIQ